MTTFEILRENISDVLREEMLHKAINKMNDKYGKNHSVVESLAVVVYEISKELFGAKDVRVIKYTDETGDTIDYTVSFYLGIGPIYFEIGDNCALTQSPFFTIDDLYKKNLYHKKAIRKFIEKDIMEMTVDAVEKNDITAALNYDELQNVLDGAVGKIAKSFNIKDKIVMYLVAAYYELAQKYIIGGIDMYFTLAFVDKKGKKFTVSFEDDESFYDFSYYYKNETWSKRMTSSKNDRVDALKKRLENEIHKEYRKIKEARHAATYEG